MKLNMFSPQNPVYFLHFLDDLFMYSGSQAVTVGGAPKRSDPPDAPQGIRQEYFIGASQFLRTHRLFMHGVPGPGEGFQQETPHHPGYTPFRKGRRIKSVILDIE